MPSYHNETAEIYRLEKDLLGEESIDSHLYYGIQTHRALKNFDLSGVRLSDYTTLIDAMAMVKKAAAKTNIKLKQIDKPLGNAICLACDEVLGGKYYCDFVVDMIQGGAGTSTNMNANEVIANIALEFMGKEKGSYQHLHPNNHVNMSQSTNDVYPTAVRLSILLSHKELVTSLASLCDSFTKKSVEFGSVLKMGRTQLQDAVPMTLGQEFNSFATTLKEDVGRISDLSDLLKEVNLGGTAIGTSINSHPDYAALAVAELSAITGLDFVLATDLVEASSDMGAFILFSSMLKRLAVKLSKICNDLRLLSSGPRTGFGEIHLPPQQPGSSIMPGKINPVIPEAVNQVAYQVIGNDLSVTLASEAGQLQLNAMEPLIVYNILESMRMLTKAMYMLRTRCIDGISANTDRCSYLVNSSIGIVTALNPYIGYENATRIAMRALAENKGVIELVLSEGLLEEELLGKILSPENMIKPQY